MRYKIAVDLEYVVYYFCLQVSTRLHTKFTFGYVQPQRSESNIDFCLFLDPLTVHRFYI